MTRKNDQPDEILPQNGYNKNGKRLQENQDREIGVKKQMTKEEILKELQEKELDDIIELIEDAENGYLEELELVEQIGLMYDPKLNEEVLNLLKSLGVKITYVEADDEEEE
ncbi:hypothetical protein TEPIDINF_001398 [Tepidibacillus infernus]|nr:MULTISPECIES: hypothetical protein [Tepidibacillus]